MEVISTAMLNFIYIMYNLIKDEKLVKEFTCTISAVDVEKRTELELEKVRTTANLKGFRKGHVPMEIIRKHYMASVLRDAINDEIDATINKIVDEKKFDLSTSPRVEFEQKALIPSDGSAKITDFKITVHLELMPQITDIDLASVKIKTYNIKLAEEEILNELTIIAKNNRVHTPSEDDGYEISNGDIANIDCVGYIDGVAFDGGRLAGHNLEIGSKSFIEGFETGLIGAKKGETRTVDTKFPEGYQASHLAGKDAQFTVIVNSIQKASIPTIDDELATKFSFESLDLLKEDIAKNINLQYGNVYKSSMKNDVFTQISSIIKFDLPPSMIQNAEKNLMKRQNVETLTSDITKEAKKSTSLSLYLSDFAAKNNINVNDEDFMNFLIQMSGVYGESPAELKKFYDKNQDAKSGVMNLIYENKIYDLIYNSIAKNEIEITKEKFDEILKIKKAESADAHSHDHEHHVHDENCNH